MGDRLAPAGLAGDVCITSHFYGVCPKHSNSLTINVSKGLHHARCCNYVLSLNIPRASLLAQAVKNLPAMQETWVRSLGWEHPLEKGMAPHFSSILAWRTPQTEEPGGLQSMELQRLTERLSRFTSQYSQPHRKEILSPSVSPNKRYQDSERCMNPPKVPAS